MTKLKQIYRYVVYTDFLAVLFLLIWTALVAALVILEGNKHSIIVSSSAFVIGFLLSKYF